VLSRRYTEPLLTLSRSAYNITYLSWTIFKVYQAEGGAPLFTEIVRALSVDSLDSA
jgi:hypothetical protein